MKKAGIKMSDKQKQSDSYMNEDKSAMTGHGSRLDTMYHYDMADNDKTTGDIKNRMAKGKKVKNTIKKVEEDHKPSKAVDDIPKQLDAAVKMHAKQAKTLRKAGIGEERDVFEETFGKFVRESALNPFQYHPEKGGTDKGTKAQRDKIAKNIASNKKSGPMSRDPYKARAGESD